MSNIRYLRDGRSFIVNPLKEPDPPKARKEKIDFLLSLNMMDVAKDSYVWTVADIRALATSLVQTSDDVTSDSINGKVSKKNKHSSKQTLIERLDLFIQKERESRIPMLAEFEEDKKVSHSLVMELWNGIEKQLANEFLAGYIVDELKKNYTTKKSLIKTGLYNFFKRVENDPEYGKHEAKIKAIRNVIYKEKLRLDIIEVNTDYRELVEIYHEDQKEIKYRPVLEFAETVLSDCEQYKYVAVTFAIGIATGRRMGEILGDTSSWEYLSTDKLRFKGLLKTKGLNKIDTWVEIHTIIDAKLVMLGIEYLQKEGKIIPKDKVNSTYSKEFSTRCPKSVEYLKEQSGLEKFKDTRDFFAAYHTHFIYPELKKQGLKCTQTSYQQDIMHHNDLVATISYEKFRLV